METIGRVLYKSPAILGLEGQGFLAGSYISSRLRL